MEKHPPQDDIVVVEGERIQFKLEFHSNPPDSNPVFLLDGSTAAVSSVMGVRLESKPHEANFSTSIHFETAGNHIVHAIWSTSGEENLEDFDSIEEMRNHPTLEMVEWKAYVISQSASIDEIRKFIDDLIRVGSVAWGGKLLKEKLEEYLMETDGDTNEDEVDEDYIQDVITNYDSD